MRFDHIQMILTQCAVCATDLGLSLGKKCGRCSTRYCGAECQVQHWKKRAATTRSVRRLKRLVAQSKYNANKKYAEAVSVAVGGNARRTRRARRATSARRPSTGRRRRVSCADARAVGRRVFAHVSCLAEQAKILVAEAALAVVNSLWVKHHE